MTRAGWFYQRRQKETFAFLVVRFFRAYRLFEGIYRDFKAVEAGGGKDLAAAGLFARIRDLEEGIVFDIKEKAHALFRSDHPDRRGGALLPTGSAPGIGELELALLGGGVDYREETHRVFAALRRSLVNRSLDAYIGTGFHMFMILRESLYQLESYGPEYSREMEQVARIETLTRRVGYDLDDEEEHELGHIREVAELCQGITADARKLSSNAFARCRALFRGTAEIIRHSIEETRDNEVLVLNLLREQELVEAVYGPGEAERILGHMFRSVGRADTSGRQKALAYARKHCGNVESLAELSVRSSRRRAG